MVRLQQQVRVVDESYRNTWTIVFGTSGRIHRNTQSRRKQNSSEMVFVSEDYYESIRNHFFFDKLVLSGNHIRYSTIELMQQDPMYMRTDILAQGILCLMLMLRRVHDAEHKEARITLDCRIDAPQCTHFFVEDPTALFGGPFFDTFALNAVMNDFHLDLMDVNNDTLFRLINRVHSLFRNTITNGATPFLRVDRGRFNAMLDRLQSLTLNRDGTKAAF